MSTKADLKERAEFEGAFEKAISPLLPIVKFKDEEPLFDFSNTLYIIDIVKTQFHHKVFGHSGKDMVSNLTCNIFIGTQINPNGIDSTGRKGRTWTINFTIKGNVRPYRCRTIATDVEIKKFYQYAESAEDVIKMFIDFINSEPGEFIKSKIKRG